MSRLIENQQDLVKWVRSQNETLDIAVAFWGAGAIKELGLDSKAFNGRILLDLISGGTNPKEVRKLNKITSLKVRCLDRLHAKAYIGKNELLIGSANASANGLGSEGSESTRWHELGIISNDALAINQARSWFEMQWNASKAITDDMLVDAEKKWKNRQRFRPFEQNGYILESALHNPYDFVGRNIYVEVSTEDYTDYGLQQIADKEAETGMPAYAFEGWNEMPIDAKLICFTEEKNVFSWDTPRICHTRVQKQKTKMKWIDPSTLDGLKPDLIAAWRPLLKRAKESDLKSWKKNEGICMDLGEFVLKFGDSSI